LDVGPPVVGASVPSGSSGAASVGSAVAGSSVAWGASVAGAAPPQAAKIMLARTNRLSKIDNLRILFFSSQNFEGLARNVLLKKKHKHTTWNNHLLSKTNYKNLSAKKQATK
jgi:hypothetical protein